MNRLILVSTIAAALLLGGLQALAAGGVSQADVLGISSSHPRDDDDDSLAAGQQDADDDEDADDADSTSTSSVDAQQVEDDCDETESHGCAVRKAVHEAQEQTPPGPERGVAVSMAARNADCSMLPQGAQDACAKRADKPHPHATPTATPTASAAASATGTPTATSSTSTQGTGKGKGNKKK